MQWFLFTLQGETTVQIISCPYRQGFQVCLQGNSLQEQNLESIPAEEKCQILQKAGLPEL